VGAEGCGARDHRRVKLKIPTFGEIWLKYQVAQLARILSTLLTGGIPLVQAMETAADSLGTPLLRARGGRRRQERARRTAAVGLAAATKTYPRPGAGHDRGGRIHRRAAPDAEQRGRIFRGRREHPHAGGLSLIEPAIMIVMGAFVAFVLIALYLPIFSLADSIH
jgi:type IV pilus assembly protein PilC